MGIENLVISITPEPIFHIKNFPITNTTIITLIVSAVIIIVSFFIRKKFKLIPKGAQNVIETVIEALLGMVDGVTNDRKQTKIFFPLVATIFNGRIYFSGILHSMVRKPILRSFRYFILWRDGHVDFIPQCFCHRYWHLPR